MSECFKKLTGVNLLVIRSETWSLKESSKSFRWVTCAENSLVHDSPTVGIDTVPGEAQGLLREFFAADVRWGQSTAIPVKFYFQFGFRRPLGEFCEVWAPVREYLSPSSFEEESSSRTRFIVVGLVDSHVCSVDFIMHVVVTDPHVHRGKSATRMVFVFS